MKSEEAKQLEAHNLEIIRVLANLLPQHSAPGSTIVVNAYGFKEEETDVIKSKIMKYINTF